MGLKAIPPVSVINANGSSSLQGGATPPALASSEIVVPLATTGNQNTTIVADNSYTNAGRPPVYSDRYGWSPQPQSSPPVRYSPPTPQQTNALLYNCGWTQIPRNGSLKTQGEMIAAAFRNEFGYLKSTTRDELSRRDTGDSSVAQRNMLNILQQNYGASINADMEKLIFAVKQSGFANCNDQARIIRYRLQQLGIPSAQIDLEFNDGRSNEGKRHTAVIIGSWRHTDRLTPDDLRGTFVIDTWKGSNKLDDVFDNPVTSGDDWAVKMQDKYKVRYPEYWHKGIGISTRPER